MRIKGSIFIKQAVLATILILSPYVINAQNTKPKQPINAKELSSPMDSSFSCSFEYTINGVNHINIRGKEINNIAFSSFDSLGNFAYINKERGRFIVNINGRKYGPYDNVNGKSEANRIPILMANGGNFAFSYSFRGREYVNINGKVMGPYQSIDPRSITITSSGNFSYSYLLNNKNRYAIINNKRYGPFPKESHFSSGVKEDSTYFYEYSNKAGDYTININGKNFKSQNVEFPFDIKGDIYSFIEDNNWFVSNKDTILGPFKEVHFLHIDQANKRVSFKFKDSTSSHWFIYDKEITSGPYQNIDFFGNKLYHNKIPVFQFQKDNGQYVSIDGNISGPFNYTKRLALQDRDNYIFAFEKRNRWYINRNGETLRGSYGLIDDVTISTDGIFAFSHRDKNNPNRSKLTINTKVAEQHDGYIDKIYLAPNGKTLTVINNLGKMYVNVFGTQYGPFPNILSVNATDSGDFYIVASDKHNARKLVIINGKVFGEFDKIETPLLGENGKYLFAGQKEGDYFIYKNGTTLGPFDSLTRLTPSPDWQAGSLIIY